MRFVLALTCLLLVGCVGPHSNGGLWAQQNLDQELALFRVSDAERADRARAFELQLADEALESERARLVAALGDCPGAARESLAVSPGDRVRDTIRLRAQGDASRLGAVAQIARADWLLRRAHATGDAQLCERARAALLAPAVAPAVSEDLLAALGPATVARDARASRAAPSGAEPLLALSLYASGWADVVRAPAPLPQYLAAVYGGVVVDPPPAPPVTRDDSPERAVDRIASEYPDWEPDALFAALGGRL